jgi:hypothetical protein
MTLVAIIYRAILLDITSIINNVNIIPIATALRQNLIGNM